MSLPIPDLRKMADLTIGTLKPSLVRKLAEVMAAVDRIPKRGRNLHFNYDYATEADIVTVVRKELASRFVMLLSQVDDYSTQDLGVNKAGQAKEPLTILKMTFTFMDGESGETLEQAWIGVGQDGGDKGVYKAMTGAEKYFLLKTFLIPTGDDPEQDPKGKSRKAAAPDPPMTVLDAATGEEVPASSRPAPPAGYAYIDSFERSNEWFIVRVLNKSGSGIIRYSTKFEPEGIKAEQAYQDGIPVRLEGKKKEGANKGDYYLQKVHLWKPEPTDVELDAEIARRELAKQAGDVV